MKIELRNPFRWARVDMRMEDPAACELSLEQAAEIRRRVRVVKEGKAVGRSAAEVLTDIEAKLNEPPSASRYDRD
ncbi:MAG: hypothetical protein JW955_13280 [Sedimentisphaerales bacterium]|nr:hypothetical protein [Sedimentisphaerales bacterium]